MAPVVAAQVHDTTIEETDIATNESMESINREDKNCIIE
jgi:hypothetical protein